MACKKYKEDLILYMYDELDNDRRESFESHLRDCTDCSQELEYTRKVFSALDANRPDVIPEGNWDKYWGEIRAHIHPLPKKSRQWNPLVSLPRWSYAAAALLIVFMMGIFAGRLWFFPGPNNASQDERDLSSVILAFNEHLDDLKPYMIEFSNFDEEENGFDVVTVDRNALKVLMVQNILLKKALTQKDPSAAQLLDDIELVLSELMNMEEGDDRTPSLIKELINKRDILFKMNILHKT